MPSIRDFSGGVLNQNLQNLDKGAGVLFDCKNVLSSWNGELRKRTGTKFLKELEGKSKVIPYRLPSGDDMIMVLDGTYIKCYSFDEDGNLTPYIVGIGPNIPFPYTGWSSNTQGDWTVSTNFGTTTEAWKAVNLGAGTVFYTTYDILNNQYYAFENQTAVVFQGADFRWGYLNRGSTEPVFKYGDSPILQYSDDGQNWRTANSIYTITKDSRVTWNNCLSSVRCFIRNTGEIEGHNFWRVLFERGVNEGTPATLSEVPDLFISPAFRAEGTPSQLIFSGCPYSVDDFDNIKWSQNGSTLMMACKGKSPYQIYIYDGYLMGATFTPSDETNIWTNNGYPASVVYYQNRLWFGGFESHPTRVWSSAFGNGNFDKFTVPATIEKTSPIMVDGTEISGTIENMWGGNNALYCLSEDGISMIDAQGAIVATDQVEFKLRNREPVNSMTPTVKNDVMIYLGRDKKKIFITDYDFVVQRFKAVCISDNYNDFFQSGIKELHYIPRKSSLIYGVLENGKWFALLFDLDKDKDALYPFETSGWVKDVQPIKYGDETKLLMITQLPTYQYVLEEKLPQTDQKIMDFMSEQEQQDYTAEVISSANAYLDHAVIRSYDEAKTLISDLPYQSGDNIEVIADGHYIGTKTVTKNLVTSYAWANADSEVVYTDTADVTVQTPLRDAIGNVLANYSISSLGTNAINVDITSVYPIYVYKSSEYIIVNPYAAFDITQTQFFRRTDLDGEIHYYNGGVAIAVFGYAWENEGEVIYTLSENPQISDLYYLDNHRVEPNCWIAAHITPNYRYVLVPNIEVGTPIYVLASGAQAGTVSQVLADGFVSSDDDLSYYFVENQQRTEVTTDRYARDSASDIDGYYNLIELDEGAKNIVMGYAYDSYAVLKFVTPYTERKFPKEIAVNFINSGYLEVGNTFDSLKSVLNNLIESVSISGKRILMNGNYAKTLDKHSFETPYVIVRSDKGLPFILTGIDYRVDMSNYQGGV